MSITLIKQGNVFAPEALGICDVLIAGDTICDVSPSSESRHLHLEKDPSVKVICAKGKLVIPGLIDSLVHINGGGGEGGFHTRTPQMPLLDAVKAGVTTVVAGLGTDSVSRSLSDLIAKAKALKHFGLSVYAYTGSYHLPAKTLLGSVTDDIMMVDEIIGLGELAISDHRGSQLHWREIAQVASQARVGGMLANKAGIVSIHVGDSPSKLQSLIDVTEHSDIPITQFYPTHINRNRSLLEVGIQWCQRGGFIDMTTSTNAHFIAEGEIPAAAAVAECFNIGIALSQVTMSSDGNASLPVFDDNGRLVGLEVGKVASLLESLKELIHTHKLPVEKALEVVTSSPSAILKLDRKGHLKEGFDADLVIVEQADFMVSDVYCRGKCMLLDGKAMVDDQF